MKNIVKIIGVAVLVAAFTQTSNAQIKASVGLELVYALESGIGIGFGATGGAEYDLNDNAGITGQIGYIYITNDFGASFSSYKTAVIPLQFGYKHYFDSKDVGFYAHGQAGFHILRFSYEWESLSYPNGYFADPVKTKEKSSFSNTRLNIALGGGYVINEHIDLGLRFSLGGWEYIGMRAAYNF